jgi:Txe/YoeB family toxin of toxin-antitoxin system
VSWKVVFTKQAQKDAKQISSAGLKDKAAKIIYQLREDPFTNNPTFEKLKGDLSGAFSRRINIQLRIVYQVYEEEKIIKVIIMWTHYG